MFANASQTTRPRTDRSRTARAVTLSLTLAATLAGALGAGPALAFPQGGQAQFGPHAQPHLNADALKPGPHLGLTPGKPALPPVATPMQGGPAKVPGFGGGYGGGNTAGPHGPNGWAVVGAGLGAGLGVGLAAGAVGAAVADDEVEECRVVRQRVVDEDGTVFVRRVARCD